MRKRVGERAVIKRLEKLAEVWPSHLLLFAGTGGIMIVDVDSNQILTTVNIPADGGDVNIITDDAGREFLAR